MVLENMYTKMGIILKECGRMIYIMELEKRVMLMDLFMKVLGVKMKKMEEGFWQMRIRRDLSKFGRKAKRFHKKLSFDASFLMSGFLFYL